MRPALSLAIAAAVLLPAHTARAQAPLDVQIPDDRGQPAEDAGAAALPQPRAPLQALRGSRFDYGYVTDGGTFHLAGRTGRAMFAWPLGEDAKYTFDRGLIFIAAEENWRVYRLRGYRKVYFAFATVPDVLDAEGGQSRYRVLITNGAVSWKRFGAARVYPHVPVPSAPWYAHRGPR